MYVSIFVLPDDLSTVIIHYGIIKVFADIVIIYMVLFILDESGVIIRQN